MSTPLPTLAPNDPLADPVQRARIDQILADHRSVPGATMVVLNELQNQIGHISPAMQAYVADSLQVSRGAVHGVVSFYSFFTTEPRGRHTIKLCMGTACYVGGTPQLIEKAAQLLKVQPGHTTEDGSVTVEICRCVGACSQAPVVVVDEEIVGRVRANKFPQLVRKVQGK